MVSACLEAYRATSDVWWYEQAQRAFDWFIGWNDLGLEIYSPETGACRDGLHVDRVNGNQGAESTICVSDCSCGDASGAEHADKLQQSRLPSEHECNVVVEIRARSTHRTNPQSRPVAGSAAAVYARVMLSASAESHARIMAMPERDVAGLLGQIEPSSPSATSTSAIGFWNALSKSGGISRNKANFPSTTASSDRFLFPGRVFARICCAV